MPRRRETRKQRCGGRRGFLYVVRHNHPTRPPQLSAPARAESLSPRSTLGTRHRYFTAGAGWASSLSNPQGSTRRGHGGSQGRTYATENLPWLYVVPTPHRCLSICTWRDALLRPKTSTAHLSLLFNAHTASLATHSERRRSFGRLSHSLGFSLHHLCILGQCIRESG